MRKTTVILGTFLALVLAVAIVFFVLKGDSPRRSERDSESVESRSTVVRQHSSAAESGITQDDELTASSIKESALPDLLVEPSDTAASGLQLWLTEFRESLKGPDRFDKYRLVSFDENVLSSIRYGQDIQFRFNLSGDESYVIKPAQLDEKSGRWHIRGSIPELVDSFVSISVFDNGSVTGQVYVPDYGTYIIRPTNTHPFHIIYLATGEYLTD